jgi:hypothetical protein
MYQKRSNQTASKVVRVAGRPAPGFPRQSPISPVTQLHITLPNLCPPPAPISSRPPSTWWPMLGGAHLIIREQVGKVLVELDKPLLNVGHLLGRALRLALLDARRVLELGQVVKDTEELGLKLGLGLGLVLELELGGGPRVCVGSGRARPQRKWHTRATRGRGSRGFSKKKRERKEDAQDVKRRCECDASCTGAL